MQDKFLTAKFPELANEFREYNLKSYEDIYRFSIENNDLFWSTLAKTRLDWYELFNQVKSGVFTEKNFTPKWFIGGKLNVSGN